MGIGGYGPDTVKPGQTYQQSLAEWEQARGRGRGIGGLRGRFQQPQQFQQQNQRFQPMQQQRMQQMRQQPMQQLQQFNPQMGQQQQRLQQMQQQFNPQMQQQQMQRLQRMQQSGPSTRSDNQPRGPQQADFAPGGKWFGTGGPGLSMPPPSTPSGFAQPPSPPPPSFANAPRLPQQAEAESTDEKIARMYATDSWEAISDAVGVPVSEAKERYASHQSMGMDSALIGAPISSLGQPSPLQPQPVETIAPPAPQPTQTGSGDWGSGSPQELPTTGAGGAGGAGGAPTSWKMSIEPMAGGGMIPGYQDGGGVLLPYQANTAGHVPMVYANGGWVPAYANGGDIPGYFLGGKWGTRFKGLLKKAAPVVLGAINPALGAGVGALISGIENKSLKSALMGGMKGYLGGKALSSGLKAASGNLLGKTAEQIAEEGLEGTLTGGLGSLVKGKGLSQFGGAAYDYVSDPKKVAALYPMLAELSEQEAAESPGGQIPSAYAAESQAVMPQSATPGYVASAQGYSDTPRFAMPRAEGGLISLPLPEYRKGGRAGRKKRKKASKRAARGGRKNARQRDARVAQRSGGRKLQQQNQTISRNTNRREEFGGEFEGTGGPGLSPPPIPAPVAPAVQPVAQQLRESGIVPLTPLPQTYAGSDDEGELDSGAEAAVPTDWSNRGASDNEGELDWGSGDRFAGLGPLPDQPYVVDSNPAITGDAEETDFSGDLYTDRPLSESTDEKIARMHGTDSWEAISEAVGVPISEAKERYASQQSAEAAVPTDWSNRGADRGRSVDWDSRGRFEGLGPLPDQPWVVDSNPAITGDAEETDFSGDLHTDRPLSEAELDKREKEKLAADRETSRKQVAAAKAAKDAAAKDAAAKAAAAAAAAKDAAARQAPTPIADPSYRAGLMAETASATGAAPITGYDPFNMPTAGQASQFDPAYGGLMSRLGGQQELGAGPAPGGGFGGPAATPPVIPPPSAPPFAEGGPVDSPMMQPGSEMMGGMNQDILSELHGTPWGGSGEGMPPEIEQVAVMALRGEMPAAQAAQLLDEIRKLFPAEIDELTNQIRVTAASEGGAGSLVSEGFLPPYPDNGLQGNGEVDDMLAVGPMPTSGYQAGGSTSDFEEAFQKRVAGGGPLPVRALLAGGEYIVNARDAEAGRQELIDAATGIDPRLSPGAAVWDDFVGNING